MYNQNRLLCPEDAQSTPMEQLQHLKLAYISKQKSQLEVQLQQLTLNNKILREINVELAGKQEGLGVGALVDRNAQMERRINKMAEENKSLRTQLFLLNQVSVQNQKQKREIMDSYEAKILTLRRIMHQKQSFIQRLQQKCIEAESQLAYPAVQPPCISIMSQRDELQLAKIQVQRLQAGMRQMRKQNERLKEENTVMRMRVDRMEGLVRNRCLYLEYRAMVGERVAKSLPKHSLGFTLQGQRYHRNGASSSNPNQPSPPLKLPLMTPHQPINRSLFQLAVHRHRQIRELQQYCIDLKRNNLSMGKQVQKYRQAYKQHNQKLKQVSTELHRAEGRVRAMVGLLLGREANKCRQQLKGAVSEAGQRVLQPQQIQQASMPVIGPNYRQEWLQLANSLPSIWPDFQHIRRHRSHSLILDYLSSPQPPQQHPYIRQRSLKCNQAASTQKLNKIKTINTDISERVKEVEVGEIGWDSFDLDAEVSVVVGKTKEEYCGEGLDDVLDTLE